MEDDEGFWHVGMLRAVGMVLRTGSVAAEGGLHGSLVAMAG
jgi:hypothetical protein